MFCRFAACRHVQEKQIKKFGAFSRQNIDLSQILSSLQSDVFRYFRDCTARIIEMVLEKQSPLNRTGCVLLQQPRVYVAL